MVLFITSSSKKNKIILFSKLHLRLSNYLKCWGKIYLKDRLLFVPKIIIKNALLVLFPLDEAIFYLGREEEEDLSTEVSAVLLSVSEIYNCSLAATWPAMDVLRKIKLAYINGMVYTFGGKIIPKEELTAGSNQVWSFNPRTNNWTSLQPLSQARMSPNLITYDEAGEDVWVLGIENN